MYVFSVPNYPGTKIPVFVDISWCDKLFFSIFWHPRLVNLVNWLICCMSYRLCIVQLVVVLFFRQFVVRWSKVYREHVSVSDAFVLRCSIFKLCGDRLVHHFPTQCSSYLHQPHWPRHGQTSTPVNSMVSRAVKIVIVTIVCTNINFIPIDKVNKALSVKNITSS